MFARLSNLYFDEIIAPSNELPFTWEVVVDKYQEGLSKTEKKHKHLSDSELFYTLPFLLLLLLFFKKFLPEKPALIYLPTLASPTRWT